MGERTAIRRCNCSETNEHGHTDTCAYKLSMDAICEDCWGQHACCWRERWRRLGFWGRVVDAFRRPT